MIAAWLAETDTWRMEQMAGVFEKVRQRIGVTVEDGGDKARLSPSSPSDAGGKKGIAENSKTPLLDLSDPDRHCAPNASSRLGGVRTVLDAGAGTGRFSIPLARQGFQVTHQANWQQRLSLGEQQRLNGIMQQAHLANKFNGLLGKPDNVYEESAVC
jgi:2-polyprenyl-3-methyl-5-hydroxy-6-metoxy-1,4-benzoquinol methylase